MQGVNKWQRDFLVEIILLFLSIKGRVNFLQLGRFGKHKEQRYRNQFEKSFDYLEFNRILVLEQGSGHYTIGFDPSYISKSGKCTPGVNYFWSGCAGKPKWGLEISGIAAIDIDNHTAFHLEAVQTPSSLESKTLVEHYSQVIIQRKEKLQTISKYVVADAYFSKATFVTSLTKNNFEIVSRLRDDANLRYLFKGAQDNKRGRPKKYDGKLIYDNINDQQLKTEIISADQKIVYGIVHAAALKCKIKVVILYTKRKKKWNHKIYFSTDLSLNHNTLLRYYQTRFQIEFLYRDGKQHTALNDSQARSPNKLYFHINASLTTINIAKIQHWLKTPKVQRGPFSMCDIKTLYNNKLLIYRFLSLFAIDPDKPINQIKINEALQYGKIAA
ncbi:MAG: transposase [Flavobacteriales bacterium]|nr:transposase [Flavobacteriales bacterium]NRA89349.1 transposase [Hyphomicrobiales bacterium]